jgi:hypothetical protein
VFRVMRRVSVRRFVPDVCNLIGRPAGRVSQWETWREMVFENKKG